MSRCKMPAEWRYFKPEIINTFNCRYLTLNGNGLEDLKIIPQTKVKEYY